MSDGLAIIGGGKIGEALLSGLIRRGGTEGIVVCERSPQRAAELQQRHGVPAVDLAGAGRAARTLLVAVKPQDIGTLLGALAEHVDPARHLVVSVAAGVTTARIEQALPGGTPVVRVMPNTPAHYRPTRVLTRVLAEVLGRSGATPRAGRTEWHSGRVSRSSAAARWGRRCWPGW